MGVITISRQLGSAGDYISGLVASMLSYKLVNEQSIIMEAQRRALVESGAVGGMGKGKPPLLERFSKSKSQEVYAIRSILRDLAGEGNAVIVGRGGNMELRDRADILNVRVISSFEARIARIMKESKVERAQAVKMLKQSDKGRAEYVKHFFLVDWSDPELYDILINTSKVLPDAAARLIEQASRQFRAARVG